LERLHDTLISQQPTYGQGAAWADYDNDGDLDLYVANNEGAFLYRNDGGDVFTSVDVGSPVNERLNFRCVSWADADRDGFLDLLTTSQFETNRLFRNNGRATGNLNHWIEIKCVGAARENAPGNPFGGPSPVSNRDGIGTKVFVTATMFGEEVTQMREITAGDGYGNSLPLEAHFGLGDATNIDVLRIEWPSGNVEEFYEQPVDEFRRIDEPTWGSRNNVVLASVSLGDSTELRVGGGSVQWQFEGVDIAGATNATLELVNVSADDEGRYTAIITTASGRQEVNAWLDVDDTFTKIIEGPHVTDLGESGFGSWADYDNDGYSDLFVDRDTLGTSAIYHNDRDGTFSRIPDPAGLVDASDYFATSCDWDNDGNQDLIAVIGSAPHIGYGDGQGDFTPRFLTEVDGGWAAYADYDRDGLIDIYQSSGNFLFHNQGNREFTTYRSTEDLGPAAVNTYGGPCWGDFDDDGWPDLYVPSLWRSRSYMFRNDGTGSFVAVSNLVTSTTGPAFQGGWGDYDNDDRLDLFVASFNGTSTLYRNVGGGEFERPIDAPTLEGTHNFVAWADYNNDGFLDLWVSGYTSENKLLRNNGDGSFTRVTTGSIVNGRPLNGAGTYQVAWFDYDNDGFLDLYVMNGVDSRSIWTANQFYHNNGNGNSWLTVKLIGTTSNRDAVGAKVRALATYTGQPRWQRRDISGGGLANGNHRYAHFGLGDATVIDTLRIEWPSGIVQEFQDVQADQFLTITEPLAGPVLVAPTLTAADELQFMLSGETGQTYRLESSTDLQSWTTVDTVTLGDPAEQTFTVTNTGAVPAVFYRVVEE